MADAGIRTYISEPKGNRRNWKDKEKKEQEALYANRRRIRGNRGKRLMRSRGELVERTFAHVYDTGGMRRTHLRGHENILKRLLIHVSGFNLGLLMRKVFGFGKPRRLQEAFSTLLSALFMLIFGLVTRATVSEASRTLFFGVYSRDWKFCHAQAEV
jgi:transposase